MVGIVEVREELFEVWDLDWFSHREGEGVGLSYVEDGWNVRTEGKIWTV